MRKKETPNPSRVRGRGVEVSETLFYCFWTRCPEAERRVMRYGEVQKGTGRG